MPAAGQPCSLGSRGSSSSSLACPEPPPSPGTLTPASCGSAGSSAGAGALPQLPLTRKALLAPAAVTPLSRLEWQIAAAGAEGAEERQGEQGEQGEQGSSAAATAALAAAVSSGQRRAAQCSRRHLQQQQEEEESCHLYEPPAWMVVAYALSTLPGALPPGVPLPWGASACPHLRHLPAFQPLPG